MNIAMQLDFSNKPIVEAAYRLALLAHDGQTRKYTGEPYINHPVRVAETLLRHGFTTQPALAAALLHDVLEDTSVPAAEIVAIAESAAVGAQILSYVKALTNTERGNRAERKAKATARIATAHVPVRAIKLADIIDNVRDVADHDPEFALLYLEEKRSMVAKMQPHPSLDGLVNEAMVTIMTGLAKLAHMERDENNAITAKRAADAAMIEAIIFEEELSGLRDCALF